MSGVRRRQAEQTQRAILQAARARFARDGFARTTIRAVAADAGIDPSMVMRYFGSKTQLFAAAADLDLALPDLARVPRERLGVTTVEHFLSRWEGTEDDSLRVLLASATTDPAAAARMQEIFRAQLQPVVAAAGPHGDDQAAVRSALVATQMLGLALCRYVLRLAPVVDLAPGAVVDWLAPTIQRYLTETRPIPAVGPVPPQGSRS